MSISLPPQYEDTVRQRAAKEGISPEEYLGTLVEAASDPGTLILTDEQRHRIGDELIRRMEDGKELIRVDDAYWENLRRRVTDRAEARRADAS